jgi:hypothetical protein
MPSDAMFDALARSSTRHRHDQVDALFIMLFEEENPTFRRYLKARDHVEGSLAADTFMAALMIRDRAKLLKLPIAREKLATIVRVLGVVLRARGLGREERRV